MSNPIRLEDYGEHEPLFELTDLTIRRLTELDDYLSMTTVPLSSDWRELHKELKRQLALLDVPRAS